MISSQLVACPASQRNYTYFTHARPSHLTLALPPLPATNGGFILVSDYVPMRVTLVGASWDVVAGDSEGGSTGPGGSIDEWPQPMKRTATVSCQNSA